MHPHLTRALLDAEADAVALNDVLSRRIDRVARDDRALVVTCSPAGRAPVQLRFDGPRYDTEPLGLVVCDPQTGALLPAPEWPGTLVHSIHPVLQRPFCCLRGLLEYHVHPSHVHDPWDVHRNRLTFPTVLGQVLGKAGVA